MVFVGYDENYLYVADPLKENMITEQYNRVLYYDEFETMWNVDIPEYGHLFFTVERDTTNTFH